MKLVWACVFCVSWRFGEEFSIISTDTFEQFMQAYRVYPSTTYVFVAVFVKFSLNLQKQCNIVN